MRACAPDVEMLMTLGRACLVAWGKRKSRVRVIKCHGSTCGAKSREFFMTLHLINHTEMDTRLLLTHLFSENGMVI